MAPTDQPGFVQSLPETMRSSEPVRILAIAVMALSLQIPIGMIDSTIAERRTHRDVAMQDVTRTWGGRQTVQGPILRVPYTRRWTDKILEKDGTTRLVEHESASSLYVLPEVLSITGRLATEIRRRGIFDIPVYVAHLGLRGEIRLPAAADLPPDTDEVHWDRMTLATGLGDPRAIRDEASLEWNGQEVSLEPGVGGTNVFETGIHAVVAADRASAAGTMVPFSIRLALAGSEALALLAAGSETEVRLESSWPSPSFEGAYLPIARTISDSGFEASWKVLRLARGFPQSWISGDVSAKQLDDSLIGIRLMSPVDAYTTTGRAVKYDVLFIVLTFGTLFLIEVMAGLRVHPVQYLLIGFSLCLFYLLLLSLAEHLGFTVAYAAAALAITILVTAYSRAVLGSRGRTAAIAGLVSGLYLYLFVLLQLEDFALLMGSVGLFLALAVVMFLTRRIDWYRLHVAPAGAGVERLAGAANHGRTDA